MATQQSTTEEPWYEPTLDRLPSPPPAIADRARLGVRLAAYVGLVAGLVAAAVAAIVTLGPAAASVTGLGGMLVVLLVGVGVIVASPALAKRGLAALGSDR